MNFNNSDDPSENEGPLGDLERLLREMLAGGGVGMNPADFARAAGLSADGASLQGLFASLQSAMNNPSNSIDWSITRKTAIEAASGSDPHPNADPVLRAFPVAGLWLDEVTDVGGTADAPRAISRVEWVQQTVETWISLAEPVAESISQTLVETLTEQLPEELQGSLSGLGPVLKSVGGTLFATQLGQIIGKLSREVIAGGDVGIPLLSGPGREGGALIPSGVAGFADGLEQDADAVTLYLAVRELAHARLFRHSKWLGLHLLTAIGDYARGIRIDTSQIHDLVHDIDPTDTERIQELVSSGALIPPQTAEQKAAHQRLETMLALIEGWVDAVTEEAVSRLPGADAIAEMVRRRRATGGPAEHAFSTLIGLELRPRRLREAAALWRLVAERGGSAGRDSLWAHPDLLPTSEEIDHPARLLERIGLAGDTPTTVEPDEFDIALAQLLDGTLQRDSDSDSDSDSSSSSNDSEADSGGNPAPDSPSTDDH